MAEGQILCSVKMTEHNCFWKSFTMTQGNFYFLTDEYYDKFSDCGLMKNKDEDEFGSHGRPCYYCFISDGFYWMIPISSKVEKYKKIYNEKIKKYPNYDGIRFGYVNGRESAFLLQNICPVTDEYIACEYKIEHNTVPVTVSKALSKELNAIARKIIRYHKNGKRIVLSDLTHIINELSKDR